MKAITHHHYGPPEKVLRIVDVPRPVPTDKEVLIKVHASTVNRTDCGFLRGKPYIVRLFSGLTTPRSKILGCEFAGEIEAVGKSVTRYKAGDKVFGFNDFKFGGQAQYMLRNEKDPMGMIPEGVSYEVAAAITEGAHYAWCDIRAAKIGPGQQVLVNGATGGIGSAAVQIIKHLGVEVTAVCDTKNVGLVKSLGADVVIDYQKEDFTKLDKKFDVVFDAVGKSSFGKCRPILKEKGIYVSTELGPRWENPFRGLVAPLARGKKVLFPIPVATQEDTDFLKTLVEMGRFKPVIDRHYPLEKIVEAYQYVETGMKTGNVIITIPH